MIDGLIHVGGHPLVMLVQDDCAPKEFSQQNKRSIFQKSYSTAGNRHVALLRTKSQQQPEGLEKGVQETTGLFHQQQGCEACHLIVAPRSGQVHVATIKGRIDFHTLPNLFTYHARAMHGRRQRHNKNYFSLQHITFCSRSF